ncbi:MAG: exodeoxyribonuclease VII small subunit [Deltaproteobacteria bacterium]|nr:exodeoxyribonuclease VII small subunit [Deltaproteobacteria bacterium]
MTAPDPALAPATDAAPRFEDLVGELEHIVAQLESGQLPLEKSLEAFERGMGLSKQAAAILDAAELKVEQLAGTATAPRTEPFDPR